MIVAEKENIIRYWGAELRSNQSKKVLYWMSCWISQKSHCGIASAEIRI